MNIQRANDLLAIREPLQNPRLQESWEAAMLHLLGEEAETARRKKITYYSFLSIFLALTVLTSLVTLAATVNLVIPDAGYLKMLWSATTIEMIAILIGLIRHDWGVKQK